MFFSCISGTWRTQKLQVMFSTLNRFSRSNSIMHVNGKLILLQKSSHFLKIWKPRLLQHLRHGSGTPKHGFLLYLWKGAESSILSSFLFIASLVRSEWYILCCQRTDGVIEILKFTSNIEIWAAPACQAGLRHLKTCYWLVSRERGGFNNSK